jgi:hypothetical protein
MRKPNFLANAVPDVASLIVDLVSCVPHFVRQYLLEYGGCFWNVQGIKLYQVSVFNYLLEHVGLVGGGLSLRQYAKIFDFSDQ